MTIGGHATPGARKGWLRPVRDVGNTDWLWDDVAGRSDALDGRLQPLVVDAIEVENPGGFPIGGQTRINLPNDHLQYAATWYILAVTLVVIYVIYHRRREEDDA